MLRPRHTSRLTAALLAATLLLPASPGWAATDEEKAGARAAAVEGVKAYAEERWADVVDLFTRAESLVHSPVHLLYIGRANLKLGKLVVAREAFMKASREHVEPDSPPAFQRAHDEAAEEFAAVDPRVAYLTVKLDGAPSSAVTVLMDGNKVPAPLIGVPRPVDPGEHKLEASGDGYLADPVVVKLTEAERKSATLVVHAGPATPQPAAPPGAMPAGTEPGAAPGDAPQGDAGAPRDDKSGLRYASYGAFGVGAVGLGLGIAFGLKATSDRSKADDLCPQGCPLSKKSEIDDLDASANSASTLAVVGWVTAGLGAAAGTTLFFLSQPKKESASTEIRPWVGLASAGVSGKF